MELSISFKIWKLNIEVGAEVGAIDAKFEVSNGIKLSGAYGLGAVLSISWDE